MGHPDGPSQCLVDRLLRLRGRGAPGVAAIPIIDAQIHLFNGTRPQGARYMGSPQVRAVKLLRSRYRRGPPDGRAAAALL